MEASPRFFPTQVEHNLPQTEYTRLVYNNLLEAIGVYRKFAPIRNLSTRRKKELTETIQWIASDSDEFLSFNFSCELFRIDPTAARKAIFGRNLVMIDSPKGKGRGGRRSMFRV